VLIVGAEVDGRPGVDVRLAGGRIVEVGPQRTDRPEPGEDVVDAAGGAVIPALHDHHVHLKATAAALASVVVDHRGLAAALHEAPAGGPGDWVRVVGYHESTDGDLDRHALDALAPDRPVRVQHRSGGLWVLNSRALDAVGATGAAAAAGAQEPGIERDERGEPTGRLWRLDGWLAGRVPPTPVDLAAVARRAADHGVAGFTDADPHRSQADVDLLAGAGLPQSVTLMGADHLTLPPADPRFGAGPRKVLLDDATLPPIAELAARFAEAHAAGRPVAVHCVTRLQLVATLAALADAGPAPHPGDRVEHGGVVPAELRPELRRLGVTVVTQPHFVAERGDQYRTDVDPDDLPLLYPCASLLAGGVRVAAGTDAPFGGPDPWAAMAAAVHRRTPTGHVLGADERVDPARALALFLGAADDPATPRRIAPGQPADVCVLDRPLAAVHRALAAGGPGPPLDPVVVTVARGEVIADRR
jgi:predicted amidohydrolase YtcJ